MTDDIDAALNQMDDLSPWFTVVCVWPETQERYLEHTTAASARQAEDLVRKSAEDAGGEIWVCGVFDGKLFALDTYATFADDPDRVTRAEY